MHADVLRPITMNQVQDNWVIRELTTKFEWILIDPPEAFPVTRISNLLINSLAINSVRRWQKCRYRDEASGCQATEHSFGYSTQPKHERLMERSSTMNQVFHIWQRPWDTITPQSNTLIYEIILIRLQLCGTLEYWGSSLSLRIRRWKLSKLLRSYGTIGLKDLAVWALP